MMREPLHAPQFRACGKILFKLLGALAALAFIYYGMQARSEITSIQKRGKFATVEPIKGFTEFRQGGSSTYTAEFHFKTQDGSEVVQKHAFPEEVLDDLRAGRPVQVVYLPESPGSFVFAAEKPSWLMVGGGVVFLVAVLLFA